MYTNFPNTTLGVFIVDMLVILIDYE